ncbi:MAG TPA: nucleotidyltransferase domain-containing protein [Candidatus Paceibacterota bacterium]|nr:nucleotidyltransferase domain-containing protein [Candidatus Paceibacterota bacterium]
MGNEEIAIRAILQNPYEQYNSRNLSKIVGISHPGMFKLLKKLKKEGILISKRVGKAEIYSLNFENNVAVKRAEFGLALEAYQNMRWIEEFQALKYDAKMVILFGSIIKGAEARDIDLFVIADKKEFNGIKKYISKKNKVMTKRAHLLLQTEEEFISDLRKKNKATIEIIKGRVLFGQDELVKLLKET